MTTREAYFKNVYMNDTPYGLVGYIIYEDGVLKLKVITMEMSVDERVVSFCVEKMQEIEQLEGFRYWTVSPDGEDLLSRVIIIRK